MKKSIYMAAILLLIFPVVMYAQSWPEKVTIVELDGKDSVIVSGDLAKGEIIDDLTWAWSSSNACFPATQSLKFRGNHVFFATTMQPRSIMKITVSPTDPAADLSIYAYR